MDKVIHKTLDNREQLTTEVSKLIDSSFSDIKIEDILRHPEGELSLFGESIAQTCIDQFGVKFIHEGIRFADEVKKMKKPVIVQDSTDPKENKDASDVQK